MAAKTKKRSLTKRAEAPIWNDSHWCVKSGELVRGRGNPGKVENLFQVIAEKIPFGALAKVERHLETAKITPEGVYVAHDSMGCPRYAGRGQIFTRLRLHKKSHPHELHYFSFYVVAAKKHEREIETLLIRGAEFLLEFNDRKKRVGIRPGSVEDFEAGTRFYERRVKRGKKA